VNDALFDLHPRSGLQVLKGNQYSAQGFNPDSARPTSRPTPGMCQAARLGRAVAKRRRPELSQRIFPNSLPFNDRFKTICGLSTQVRQLHPSMDQTAAA
jgi:hypothetical protein